MKRWQRWETTQFLEYIGDNDNSKKVYQAFVQLKGDKIVRAIARNDKGKEVYSVSWDDQGKLIMYNPGKTIINVDLPDGIEWPSTYDDDDGNRLYKLIGIYKTCLYLYEGRLVSDDVTYKDRNGQYCVATVRNGLLHSINDKPALIINAKTKVYYENGVIHRENKPAIIRHNEPDVYVERGLILNHNVTVD